jgi:acetyl esterase/lipase
MRRWNHVELIKEHNLREAVRACLDTSRIPDAYKLGKGYYEKGRDKKWRDKKSVTIEKSFLYNDHCLSELVAKLHHPSMSPLLADDRSLVGLPRAYFLIVENDTVKDESLLYAERLKKAGVDVDIVFYDNKDAYHGVATQTDRNGREGKQARIMQDHLISYLEFHL